MVVIYFFYVYKRNLQATMPKPTKTYTKNYYVKMTGEEWDHLEDIAAKSGKKNSRRFIHTEMYRLYNQLNEVVPNCDTQIKRKLNIYKIPEELKPFYANLACMLGISVSEVISRLIIHPHLNTAVIKELAADSE